MIKQPFPRNPYLPLILIPFFVNATPVLSSPTRELLYTVARTGDQVSMGAIPEFFDTFVFSQFDPRIFIDDDGRVVFEAAVTPPLTAGRANSLWTATPDDLVPTDFFLEPVAQEGDNSPITQTSFDSSGNPVPVVRQYERLPQGDEFALTPRGELTFQARLIPNSSVNGHFLFRAEAPLFEEEAIVGATHVGQPLVSQA
ncbi:MAG: hypothetical protein AAGA96_01910 [Verrucomicrobiota bacterium]